jgi:hypothetical protein
VLAGAALTAGLLISGCSAGQNAETAHKQPSVAGVNTQVAVLDSAGKQIGSVGIRDLLVPFGDDEGYPAGGEAPLQFVIFNDTASAVTVRVTSPEPEGQTGEVVRARSVELAGAGAEAPAPPAATPTPSGSASPSPGAVPSPTPSPAGRPATIEVPAGGYEILNPDSDQHLKLVGLSGELSIGTSVSLQFEFSNGAEPLRVVAPVGPPLSPGPRHTPEPAEGDGH